MSSWYHPSPISLVINLVLLSALQLHNGCWSSKAGLLITAGEVAVLSEVVSKRGLLCTIASMLHHNGVLPICLASKDHLTRDTHCFHLTQEDHMIPTGILCYHAGVDKGEGVVNDRRSRCRNMIAGMAETLI